MLLARLLVALIRMSFQCYHNRNNFIFTRAICEIKCPCFNVFSTKRVGIWLDSWGYLHCYLLTPSSCTCTLTRFHFNKCLRFHTLHPFSIIVFGSVYLLFNYAFKFTFGKTFMQHPQFQYSIIAGLQIRESGHFCTSLQRTMRVFYLKKL